MEDRLTAMLLAFGLSGAILARAAVAKAALRRQFLGLEEALRRYAAARGMTFIPASPGWNPRSPAQGIPPAVAAEVHHVPIDLAVQTLGDRPSTRVEASLPSVSPGFLMAIYRRGSLGRFRARLRHVEETPTGNKVFDKAFSLLSNDADQARSILDRRLAQVVGAFPRPFTHLYVSSRRFTLIWAGAEHDFAVLDAAVHLVWTGSRRRA